MKCNYTINGSTQGLGVWSWPCPPDWPALARSSQLKPGLVVLGHGLVEQRAFGVTRVVELGFGGLRHEFCANTQYSADLASTGLRSKTTSKGRFL